MTVPCTPCQTAESDELNLRPLLPPMFDGDYWIDEAARLHRLVEKKSDTDFVTNQVHSAFF